MHRNNIHTPQSISQIAPKPSTHHSKSKKHWNTNSGDKNNKFLKCEFRTIYKYRENHKTCHRTSTKAEPKGFDSGAPDVRARYEGKGLGGVGNCSAYLSQSRDFGQSQIVGVDVNMDNSNEKQQQYQTAAHQQMKSFIKMMKKGSSQTNNTNRKLLENSKVTQANNYRVVTCQSSRSVSSTASVPKLFHQKHMKTSVTEQQQPIQNINRSSSAMLSRMPNTNPSHNIRNSTSNQPTLNELGRKIQQLITAKLAKKYDERVLLRSQVFEDEVDRELKLLVKQTRMYRASDGDCDIKEIARKICLIQKVIASSSTQSECLKKYFQSKQKNRKKFAIFNPKSSSQPQTHQQITAKCQQNNSRINDYRKYIKKNLSLQNFKNSPNAHNNLSTISLHHSTINMSSYVKPGEEYYRNQFVKERGYLPNRQPFPRTTYQKEFLSYGAMPTYPPFGRSISQNKTVCQHKQKQNQPNQPNNCNTRPETEQNKAPTTYKADYRQKKTNLTDSFTLDCRRDKYKNLDISFMPRKSANLNNSYNYGNHSYGSGIQSGKYKCPLKKIQRKSEAESCIRNKQGKQKQNTPIDNLKSPQPQPPAPAPKQPESHLNPPLNLTLHPHEHPHPHPYPKTQHQSQFVDINNNSFIQSEQKEKNLRKLKYGLKCLFGYGNGNWNGGGIR